MKKRITSALLFAAAFTTQLYAQTVTATYTGKHLKDQMKVVFTGTINETDTFKQESTHPPTIYSYVYSSGKSLTTMTDDGGYSKSSDPAKHYTVIAPTVLSIYKDATKNLIRSEQIIEDKPESRAGHLINYNWQITKEKATIAGYKCYKATGKFMEYPVTAWFTKDIKVSDGPTQFSGLPGLILKASVDDFYEIEASNIKVSDTTTAVNEPEAKGSIQPF